MKGFIGVVLFCSFIGAALCVLVGGMCLVGFAPNCEPTSYGYADFWSKMFATGFGASFGGWCLMALACATDKFFSKGS